MSEPEEVLDLDTPPVGTPMRAWGWRQGLFLGAAVLGVAAVLVAVLLWPAPRPVPTVVGLSEAPVPAWSIDRSEASLLAATCGSGGIGVFDAGAGQIGCRALDDGAELWMTEIDDAALGADGEPVFVDPLEGTDLIRVVAGTRVRLLDSGSGEIRHVIERPWSPEVGFGPIPIFSSDRGTLFWVEPQDAPLTEARARLSLLREPDPATAVWSISVGADEVNSGWGTRLAVEHRGYLWLRDSNWDSTSYALAVRLDDGEVPQWSRELSSEIFQGSTVIGSTPSGLEARDIGSNRKLWERSTWGERALTIGDGVYVINHSETVVLNPDTGRGDPASRQVISPVTRVDPRTGREIWRVEVPHSVQQLDSFGQRLLMVPVISDRDELQISALDPSDGSTAWTRKLGMAQYGGHYWGDGYLLVTYLVGDDQMGEQSRMIALDSETGASLWNTELESYPIVVGQRMITFSESKLQVYR